MPLHERYARAHIQKKLRPARTEGVPGVQFTYADFLKSTGNAIIFPRCSWGIHFTFALNRDGM
jgi:hypothetical protein